MSWRDKASRRLCKRMEESSGILIEKRYNESRNDTSISERNFIREMKREREREGEQEKRKLSRRLY